MRQVIVGGYSTDPLNTAATEYNTIYGREANTWNSAQAVRRQIIPGNGIAHSLKVFLSAAPGGGGAYVFTLRVQNAATAVAVTITDPATSAEITTTEAALVAGDRWNLECAPSGSPTATPTAQWSFIVEDTDDVNRCWITGGHNNTMSPLLNEKNSVAGGDTWATVLAGFNGRRAPVPISGTVRNLFVQLSAAPGAGTNFVISLQLGAAALLSVTISGTNTSGSDTGSSTVSVGDNIRMDSNPTNTPTARYAFWGFCFEPDEPYKYPVFGESTDFPANGEYNSLFSAGELWTATETSVRTRVKMGIMSNFAITSGTAPGSGQSTSITLVVNGVDTITVTLSDTATVATNSTDYVEVQDDDEVSIKATLSGGTSTTDLGWSIAYFTYSPWMYSSREGNMGN